MLVCQQCGRPDVPGTIFCQNCGASLEPDEQALFRGGADDMAANGRGAQPERDNGSPTPASASAYATPPISGGFAVPTPADGAGERAYAAPEQKRSQTIRPTAAISGQSAPPPPPEAPVSPPPYPVPPIVELRLPNGHIFVLSGKMEYRIGRRDIDQPAPDVDFTDWDGATAGVSRNHVLIAVTPDGVLVEDEESRNGTLCNGDRLRPRQRYLLNDRDELRLGTIMLRVLFVYPEQ